MTDTTERFPLARLEGSPEEIGRSHGKIFSSRVSRCFEFYRALLPKVSDAELEDLSGIYRETIKAFRPAYAAEIEGIADGAGLSHWKLYALNSRTELLRHFLAPKECTALYFRKTAVIGENWDWAQELEELTVVLQIERTGAPAILLVTEPGIIGKMGLNSAGIGVCLNILRSPDRLGGVPFHVLLRALLDCNSVAEARAVVSSTPLGTMSNIIVGDDKGNVADFEIAGSKIAEWEGTPEVILHTNHYLRLPVENSRADFVSSYARFERAHELLPSLTSYSVDEMKRLLGDTCNEANAICSDFAFDDVIKSIGTVTTVIMDLPKREMHFTPGNPRKNPFRVLRLGS